EERYSEIERANAILLNRMSHIMRGTGSIDSHLKRKGPMSLNQSKRQRELERINQENRRILRRITSRKPTYSRVDQMKSYQQHQARMENLCELPCVLHENPVTERQKRLTGADTMAEEELDGEGAFLTEMPDLGGQDYSGQGDVYGEAEVDDQYGEYEPEGEREREPEHEIDYGDDIPDEVEGEDAAFEGDKSGLYTTEDIPDSPARLDSPDAR
ncbi:KIAA1430 homologue, partial [Kipferlia bialata]